MVGGGVAGVSAAIKLQGSANVTLCESSSKLGGRINSRFDKLTGDSIDNGQHLLIGAYTSFLEMMSITNSQSNLKYYDQFKIPYYSKNQNFTLDATKIKGDLGLLKALWDLPLPKKHLRKMLRFIIKIKLGFVRYESLTCKEFLKKYNQNDSVINIFWEPLILATLNTPVDTASAELFVNVLKMGFFANSKKRQFILPNVGLSELMINSQKYLDNKINLKLKTTCTAIAYNNEKVSAKINGVEIEYDKIILALPIRKSASLLKNEMLSEISNKLSSRAIISVYLWYDKCFFEQDFAAFLGTNIQWVFNKRKIGFLEGFDKFPEYLSITISAADSLIRKSSKEIAEICDLELKSIFHDAEKAKLMQFKVIKERFATFDATVENQIIRKNLPSVHPKISFVGDWTYSDFPSTIEGAARSGENIKI
ncbi:hydroxysqualene dehydroxylase HpnE [Candidatus Kapabacteria bacterium]|nr:hydroxysqualene dehydroxylase HpnE [Candidatus Kapabacteria bacterium]